MSTFCLSNTSYKRLPTREVKIGEMVIGNFNRILMQTMTTTNTMDVEATAKQIISCIEAGADIVRVTAPSKKEAEQLKFIKKIVRNAGYHTPLVADIHYTPNAAEIAARYVEKVRINPGNYIDKKKFEFKEYSDKEYAIEMQQIADRFIPLIQICELSGTCIRIGTNHGSLSDRIMSRYGDTPIGMVESAMEFIRIARSQNFHQIVVSMKSSNTLVMVHAYRLLVKTMLEEFQECYPMHLGVTEAGDGSDGRIKSALGIGTLLHDGIGDTIRVSLTEDPECELPVCKHIIERIKKYTTESYLYPIQNLPFNPYEFIRRPTEQIYNLGNKQAPVVIADLSYLNAISPQDLNCVGYIYNKDTDKWFIQDNAADFIYTKYKVLDFAIPGFLKVFIDAEFWPKSFKDKYIPVYKLESFKTQKIKKALAHVIIINEFSKFEMTCDPKIIDDLKYTPNVIIALKCSSVNFIAQIRQKVSLLSALKITCPIIVFNDEFIPFIFDYQLIKWSIDFGSLCLDGLIDGICLSNPDILNLETIKTTPIEFANNTAFQILQATRLRISKTEYISCPSCGRTLFDLQETTQKIRAVTNHLKGVKIAIMGCIVNGPGEMADADFGYVGSGPGKITLYRGKTIVKRNIDSEHAVDELIQVIKDYGAWIEPTSLHQIKKSKTIK